MIVFEEESVDLSGQEGEVNGFFHNRKGVEGQCLGEKSFFRFKCQEDAGQLRIELSDDFEGLHAGEIGHGVVDDGQVDFLDVDESGDVGGGISDEGVNATGLEDFFDSLRPSPVGVTEQHVNALRI